MKVIKNCGSSPVYVGGDFENGYKLRPGETLQFNSPYDVSIWKGYKENFKDLLVKLRLGTQRYSGDVRVMEV